MDWIFSKLEIQKILKILGNFSRRTIFDIGHSYRTLGNVSGQNNFPNIAVRFLHGCMRLYWCGCRMQNNSKNLCFLIATM